MKNLNYNLLNILLGVLASFLVSIFIIISNAITVKVSESWIYIFFYFGSLISCLLAFRYGFLTLRERKAYEIECERIHQDKNIEDKENAIKEDPRAENAFVFFKSQVVPFLICIAVSFLTLGIGAFIEKRDKDQSLADESIEEEKYRKQLIDELGLLKNMNKTLCIKIDSLENANRGLVDSVLELENKIK